MGAIDKEKQKISHTLITDADIDIELAKEHLEWYLKRRITFSKIARQTGVDDELIKVRQNLDEQFLVYFGFEK